MNWKIGMEGERSTRVGQGSDMKQLDLIGIYRVIAKR